MLFGGKQYNQVQKEQDKLRDNRSILGIGLHLLRSLMQQLVVE